MTTNRLVLILVTLTLVIQGTILYRQWRSGSEPTEARVVRQAPDGLTIPLKGLAIEGKESAGLVLIEFSDYECPFCARHATGVAKELKEQFVAPGKIRHVFVNNPLSIHPNAKMLAMAAVCADSQGKFWNMHDALFSERPKDKSAVRSVAKQLNLDIPQFELCFESSAQAIAVIDRDMALAAKAGLKSTPNFAIGRIDSEGNAHIDKLLFGALPLSTFAKTIDSVNQKASS